MPPSPTLTDASSDLDTFPPAQAHSPAGAGASRLSSERSSLDSLREAVTANPVSPDTINQAQEEHKTKMWAPTWVIIGTWIGLSTGVILYK